MKKSLEDKIAGAFLKNDEQQLFENKELVWKKIETIRHGSQIVPLIWKIAAVFFGILLAGSMWATFSIWKQSESKISDLAETTRKLETTIDSLKNIEPVVKTEIQYIEKEKVVFRERETVGENLSRNNKIQSLLSQIGILQEEIATIQFTFRQKEDSLNRIIQTGLKPLLADRTPGKENKKAFVVNPVPVPAKEQIQVPSPSAGMRLKILHQPEMNKQYDSNTTLLKKTP